jgi:serine phosphatase RsbU (regulator of sigma subunit)
MFITAQLAFCDVGRKEIRVAGAGHPPLLLAGDQGDVRETASGGPPIGILEASAFPEDVVVWKNSRLLMFTDGLIEARDPVGGLLGLEAAKGELAAAARGGLSGGETRDALSSLLVRFEKGTAPADDTAFIVMVTTHE